MSTNDAKIVLSVEEMWNKAHKETINDNVSLYLKRFGLDTSRGYYTAKMNYLAEVTSSSYETVCAWFNHSRRQIKIPLLKLCKIAIALDVDIKDLLTPKTDDDIRKLFDNPT